MRFVHWLLLLVIALLAACTPAAPPITVTPVVIVAPATGTPTPAATETPTPAAQGAEACQIVVRTPLPSAPTASSFGTPLPQQVDPHVAICVNAAELAVGETLVLVGQAVDIGLPAWNLRGRENGAGEFASVVEVTGEGQVKPGNGAATVLSFVASERSLSGLVVRLTALSAGSVELELGATGEIHWGYPGPATWAGGNSETITVNVAQP